LIPVIHSAKADALVLKYQGDGIKLQFGNGEGNIFLVGELFEMYSRVYLCNKDFLFLHSSQIPGSFKQFGWGRTLGL